MAYQIVYEVTKACNQHCVYCYNHWNDANGRNVPAKEKPQKTLKKLLKNEDVDHITFSGGEPGLSEDLEDMIFIAKEKGCKVTVITNGTSLSKQRLDFLVQLSVDVVEVTLNSSTAYLHEKMNGVKGSFNKAVNTIKYLVAHQVDIVGAIVITKENAEEVGKTISLFDSLGVSRVMVNRYNLGGIGLGSLEALIPPKDILYKCFKEAEEAGKRSKMRLTAAVCTPKCIINPNEFKRIRFSYCSIGKDRSLYTVDGNGDVRMCNHSPEIMGNIYKQPIAKMQESSYMKKWQQLPTYCIHCEWVDSCKGGCRAASEQMGLGLETVDPLVLYYNEKEK